MADIGEELEVESEILVDKKPSKEEKIELIKPCLWDTSKVEYKNWQSKAMASEDLSRNFNLTTNNQSQVLFLISFLGLFSFSFANEVKNKTATAPFFCSIWAAAILFVLICNTTCHWPILALDSIMVVATCNIKICCVTSCSSRW